MESMKRTLLILTFVALLLVISFISAVTARGGVFVIAPMGEITENVELKVSDKVVGNVSAGNGLIDFSITSPSGIVLLCYNKTTFNAFSFAAEENGTYTMHLANTDRTENENATLNYVVHFEVVLQAKANVGFSVGTVHVIAPSPPPPDTDYPEWDNLYEKYLNFLGSSEILRIVRDYGRYLPLRNMVLVIGCIISIMGLIEIARQGQRKHVFHANVHRHADYR